MEYKVDFDALDIFNTSITNQVDKWDAELLEIDAAIKVLKNSANMSGSGADSIRSYFNMVHGYTLELLRQLITSHKTNCFLYKRDYFSNIDTGLHTVIHENEIKEIKNKIKTEKNNAIDVDDAIANALHQIRDIFYLNYSDITSVDEAHSTVTTLINNLDEKINALETRHFNNDFDDTGNMIAALTSFLNQQSLQSRNYKTSFDMRKLAGSETFQNLYAAYVQVSKEQQEIASLLETEVQNDKERVLKLQEEQLEREKKAKAIRWIVTGVCIVGAIALSAVTAGIASPLVAAAASGAISAGVGVITAGTNNLTNQYIQHGNLIENSDDIDWRSFGKDVAKEGAIGFVTGFVGSGIGAVAKTYVTSTAKGIVYTTKSSTLINKVLTPIANETRLGKVIIGSASNVSSGMTTRGLSELYETNGDMDSAIKEAVNPSSIAKDSVLGAIDGGISSEAELPNGNINETEASIINEIVSEGSDLPEKLKDINDTYKHEPYPTDYKIYDNSSLNNMFEAVGLS